MPLSHQGFSRSSSVLELFWFGTGSSVSTPEQLQKARVLSSLYTTMEKLNKQQWSTDETSYLLGIWSSEEVQRKLEGSTRSKAILQQLQKTKTSSASTQSAIVVVVGVSCEGFPHGLAL